MNLIAWLQNVMGRLAEPQGEISNRISRQKSAKICKICTL